MPTGSLGKEPLPNLKLPCVVGQMQSTLNRLMTHLILIAMLLQLCMSAEEGIRDRGIAFFVINLTNWLISL